MVPTFSVVMTAYQTFHFLPRALAGLMAQEHPAWELLLLVDGPAVDGPHAPRPIVDRLRRRLRGRRIDLWELPRAAGCHGNVGRNFALAHAAGDYVCWVNHDNLIFPRYLAAHAENVRKTPGCISVVDIDYWKEDRYHGRYPRRLARSRIDLLNFAVPLAAARAVNAFGGAASRVYAADWITFEACRRTCPVEQSRELGGVHF